MGKSIESFRDYLRNQGKLDPDDLVQARVSDVRRMIAEALREQRGQFAAMLEAVADTTVVRTDDAFYMLAAKLREGKQ